MRKTTTITVLVNGVKAEFDEGRMKLDFSDVLDMDDAVVSAKYEVCDSCDGRGTTTAHIEPDGGGFTASEWEEACYDDPDFAEDYFSGVYDRDCPSCDGRRVVPVPLENSRKILEAIQDLALSEAEYRREAAMWRRVESRCV